MRDLRVIFSVVYGISHLNAKQSFVLHHFKIKAVNVQEKHSFTSCEAGRAPRLSRLLLALPAAAEPWCDSLLLSRPVGGWGPCSNLAQSSALGAFFFIYFFEAAVRGAREPANLDNTDALKWCEFRPAFPRPLPNCRSLFPELS